MIKKLTEEHKKKIQEGREKKKEEKVYIELKDVIISSYDYGWQVKYRNNSPVFYTTLKSAIKYIYEQKLITSSAKSIEELIKAIKKTDNYIETITNKLISELKEK